MSAKANSSQKPEVSQGKLAQAIARIFKVYHEKGQEPPQELIDFVTAVLK